jgi:hypothetical protein
LGYDSLNCSISSKPTSFDQINCVSNSNKDPNAIFIKCGNSFLDDLEEPSAIFEGTDTEHLLI